MGDSFTLILIVIIIVLAIGAIYVDRKRYNTKDTFTLKAESSVVSNIIGLGKETVDGTPLQYWASYGGLTIYENKNLESLGLSKSECVSPQNPTNSGTIETIVPGKLPTDGRISQILWCNGTRQAARSSITKPLSIEPSWSPWGPITEA